jgi:hypothetical protein
MPPVSPHLSLVLLAALVVGGCAQAMPGYEPPTSRNEKRLSAPDPGPPGVMTATGYTLSEAERKYDCKRLTAIVQIKLLQIRDPGSRPSPTLAARAGPYIGGPIFGSRAPDPAGERATEIARLRAYNAALAEKGCRAFDIDAELAKGAMAPIPRTSAPASPAKQ